MDTMKSLLGIMLRSKCKWRKSVKALRMLLPTWLALMNSSQRLRQKPKWRTAFIWLRWLITLLNVFLFLFFYTSFNLKQSHEVCAEPVVLLVWKCVLNSSVAVGTSTGSPLAISADAVKSKPCAEVRRGCIQVPAAWCKIDIWMFKRRCRIKQTPAYLKKNKSH